MYLCILIFYLLLTATLVHSRPPRPDGIGNLHLQTSLHQTQLPMLIAVLQTSHTFLHVKRRAGFSRVNSFHVSVSVDGFAMRFIFKE